MTTIEFAEKHNIKSYVMAGMEVEGGLDGNSNLSETELAKIYESFMGEKLSEETQDKKAKTGEAKKDGL